MTEGLREFVRFRGSPKHSPLYRRWTRVPLGGRSGRVTGPQPSHRGGCGRAHRGAESAFKPRAREARDTSRGGQPGSTSDPVASLRKASVREIAAADPCVAPRRPRASPHRAWTPTWTWSGGRGDGARGAGREKVKKGTKTKERGRGIG